MQKIYNRLTRGIIAYSIFVALTGCNDNSDEPIEIPKNSPPVAIADIATVTINTPTNINVLVNDSDPDGDSISLVSVTLLTGSGHAEVKDESLWFTADKLETAKIQYVIEDANGSSATSYVDVTIKDTEQSSEKLYAGTDTCLTCHTNKSSFKKVGHNFVTKKVVGGIAPELPYGNIDGAMKHLMGVETSNGTKVTGWSDIGYVIGGYIDYMMYTDTNGFVINAWINNPKDGEKEFTFQDYPWTSNYTCGQCHTTGWKSYTSEAGDERNRNRQDDWPNMDGTFEMLGVQCEACHGAGKEHAKNPSRKNITKIAEPRLISDLQSESMGAGLPMACSECHSYDGRRSYPDYVSAYEKKFGKTQSIGGRTTLPNYSGGGYTIDSLQGIDPDTGEAKGKMRFMSCNACHDPHKSTHNRDKEEHSGALRRQCTDCHGEKPFTQGNGASHAGIECTACHMPDRWHLFKIDISKPSDDSHHYGVDGKDSGFRQPWNRPVDSCKSCHETDYEERAAMIGKMHR